MVFLTKLYFGKKIAQNGLENAVRIIDIILYFS